VNKRNIAEIPLGAILLTVVVVLLIGFGGMWIAEGNNFFMYRFFAPKQEAVRREVFENTKSYNEGMAQEIMQAEIDYAKADKDGKAAIRSVVNHRTAGYDTSRLSPDLQKFVMQCRNGGN
jgi:hypothetical protein